MFVAYELGWSRRYKIRTLLIRHIYSVKIDLHVAMYYVSHNVRNMAVLDPS